MGYSESSHGFEGLGADDKNGIWIALSCLKKYPAMKVAFFVQEEVGCRGSSNADMDFFGDVLYVIEPDRRGAHDLITEIGWSEMCSREFIDAIEAARWQYAPTDGMMTDIEALKERGLEVNCINLSCGYYNPHTHHEITVIRDLLNCLDFVEHIIETIQRPMYHQGEYRERIDWDWMDFEDVIYSELRMDPTMRATDLYNWYHYMYPGIGLVEYEKTVNDYLKQFR